MPTIRSLNDISAKWKLRGSQAQGDYQRGVETTQKDWQANTTAAVQNYNDGVTAAIGANRFAAGVAAAGNAKWKKNTIEKGPARWSQGIQVSVDNYERGFAPYRDVIANTTLPPRGPRGATQNYQRAIEMGTALHRARVGGA